MRLPIPETIPRLDIVAINKKPGAQSVTINIAHAPTL